MQLSKNKKDTIALAIFFLLIAIGVVTRFEREMLNYRSNVASPVEVFER